MAYSDKVLDHYENPRNVGSFDKSDDHVGTGMVGAPACGDVMKLQIRVNDQGVIEAGKRADIVAVPGNPVDDINAVLKVDFVMKDGQVYGRPTLDAPAQ